jgi:hypothetical protein
MRDESWVKLKLRFSLPDALDLMVVCVEAGLGLDQTLLTVSRELETTHPELCMYMAQPRISRSQGNGYLECGPKNELAPDWFGRRVHRPQTVCVERPDGGIKCPEPSLSLRNCRTSRKLEIFRFSWQIWADCCSRR